MSKNGKVTKIDYDRVATILIEAAFFGDKPTAKRWGITNRTIINYRNRLADDTKLSHLFALKKVEFEAEWASEIPAAIRAGIHFLGEAAKVAKLNDPAVIHAVAGAVKILAEVGLTKELLDAKLGRFSIPDRTQD
jgi:hypothetical protein